MKRKITQTIQLTKIAKTALKDRETLRKIAEACSVTPGSVHYWIRTDSIMLTTATVIGILESETGLSRDQILENTNVQQTAA